MTTNLIPCGLILGVARSRSLFVPEIADALNVTTADVLASIAELRRRMFVRVGGSAGAETDIYLPPGVSRADVERAVAEIDLTRYDDERGTR